MNDADRDGDDEDDAVSLVRLAGARPVPSAERTVNACAYVHAAWRAGIRRRRARTAFLLAAAGLAAVALALVGRRSVREEPIIARAPAEPATAVARVDAAAGLVERESPFGWMLLGVGDPLPTGSHLRTGAQGAGFRLQDGRSVRVRSQSRVRWVAFDRLTLESGAVYVDSGRGTTGPSSFEVQTPWGAVRETGTQFEVGLEQAALRVRVREGRVAVLGRGPTVDVASATELRVDDGGSTRRAIALHGPDWAWVLALAPAFEMEGRSLHDLLAWAAREAGWELRYEDAESRRRSESAQLHGSIRGLRPDEAVAVVIPSTGLPHRLHEGVLRVGPAHAAGVQ